MKLPKILVDFVLGSDNAKKTIAEIVGKTTEGLAKEAAQIIKQKTTPRKYITTSTRNGIMAKEQSTKKDMNVLWEVYSDSPGSVQSANRITESVIGGGYVIEKEVGPEARKATQKDLRKLIDFFDKPNPDDTIETLMSSGLENFLAYGDWYMEKVPTKRTRTGRKFTIAELYGLNTADMTILVDPDIRKRGILKKVGYKRKTEEEKDVIYDLNEICQIRRPSSTAGVYGRAVLETNGLVLQLLLRALIYNTSVLKNGGRPPIQIILPEDTNENDADAVNAFYETNQMGPNNAGKPLVLFKGAKAEAIGITPQDMAYLELIMTGIKLVAGQYGVPLFLIGFPEGSNRACYSADTEVLTGDGWKYHWEVDKNEKIAVFDSNNRSVFFEKPKKLSKYKVEEHLIHFKNKKGGDILVTEDHTMFYRQSRGKYQIKKAKEIEHLKKVITLSAPNAFISHYKPREKFKIDAVYHQNHKKNEKDTYVPLNNWLAFVGLYLSEGGLFVKGEQSHNYVITFAQSDNVNRLKADKIDKLISLLPFSFGRCAKGKDNCRRWTIYDKNLWTYLKNNCGGYSHQKRVPRDLINLPTKELRILFDWLILGDGHIDKRVGRNSMSYATTSKQLADDVQEIAFRLGYNTKIVSHIDKRNNRRKELFTVRISEKVEKHYSSDSNYETIVREKYKGDVYCFSVSTGFYVTRRNGCIALQGNSSSEERRAFYYTNIYPLRKYISHKFTNEIIKEGMGIEGWKLNFRGQGLEESEATRRDLMTAWGKGLANWNDVRIKMGWLPIDEKWASQYYLLGSKNDSLMPIEDAIGKEPSKSAPEVPQIKPSGEQGEGADMQPTGEGQGKETKSLIKKIETLVEVLSKQKK